MLSIDPGIDSLTSDYWLGMKLVKHMQQAVLHCEPEWGKGSDSADIPREHGFYSVGKMQIKLYKTKYSPRKRSLRAVVPNTATGGSSIEFKPV